VTVLLATSTPHSWDPGSLLLLAAVLLIGYLAACAWWPFAACRRCDGAGKFRSPSGKAWRRCRRCKGSGSRVRWGRRVYEVVVQTRNRM
jgi:hypothetical protein